MTLEDKGTDCSAAFYSWVMASPYDNLCMRPICTPKREVIRCILYYWYSSQNMKTSGDFSLVVFFSLLVIGQYFNWIMLILCNLIFKLRWNSSANNEAMRHSNLAPEVVCQTKWRENDTRALQRFGKHANHNMHHFRLFHKPSLPVRLLYLTVLLPR